MLSDWLSTGELLKNKMKGTVKNIRYIDALKRLGYTGGYCDSFKGSNGARIHR